MAFAATALSGDLARAWSIGPVKVELQACSAANADTSGTVTANSLERVDVCLVVNCVTLDDAPSISGKEVTLSFADPGGDVDGHVILIGR